MPKGGIKEAVLQTNARLTTIWRVFARHVNDSCLTKQGVPTNELHLSFVNSLY
jgi:hypothetical protein